MLQIEPNLNPPQKTKIVIPFSQVSAGDQAGTDLGPVISPQSKARIERLIESGVQDGADVCLDGRGLSVPGLSRSC